MRRWAVLTALLAVLGTSSLAAQDFPDGVEGELYYAPRLDLVPAEDGGPLTIELDGELDDVAWERAAWQGWAFSLQGADPIPENADMEWAASSDGEWLYFACRVTDDFLQNTESTFCDIWNDDSIEVYIDANNNGPDCVDAADSCYEPDDAQLSIGANNIGVEDPELLEVGGNAGSGACDFSQPEPDLIQGVVTEVLDDDENYVGWQAEIAIALETLGNNLEDGTPEWQLDPEHGLSIGFNVQLNDDDDGTDRDGKLTWSASEAAESSWRNPGIFGKLMFVDPTQDPPPLEVPVRNVSCALESDGSALVSWENPESGDAAVETSIQVDGTEVLTVPGDAETATIPAGDIPDDGEDHIISIVNNSGQPTECALLSSDFDACGGLRRWNILGSAYAQPNDCCPDAATIRLDYMTDGETGELDFVWRPGAEIETDVGGAAASTAINGGANDRAPGGIPTVFTRFAQDARVMLIAEFGEQIEGAVAYAQIYVIAEEPTDAYIALASDDSIQVFVNGQEVWLNSVGRGGASSCSPQDYTTEPVLLEEGHNSLMVKVFNGVADWDFTLRFQEDTGVFGGALTEGLSLSFEPGDIEPPKQEFRRGDPDNSGGGNITDAIAVLNHLFAGDAAPGCFEAADVNNDAAVNIADPVFHLNFLFGGGPPPSPPGPDDCGEDPDPASSLGCETYDTCAP